MNRSLAWAGSLCALWLAGCASSAASRLTVAVPVVDLRAEPGTAPIAGTHDPLQETQLLYGEAVRVVKRDKDWTRVEALEQPEFTHAKKWQGYPGWVRSDALRFWDEMNFTTILVTAKWASLWGDPYLAQPLPWRLPLGTRLSAINMGDTMWKVELVDGTFAWMRLADATPLTALAMLPSERRRARILSSASRLLGDPYFWGGRSPHNDQPLAGQAATPVTGVDCSGLTNLAYRAAGIEIPRDAHEQFLRAKPVERLEPADLLFLSAKDDPEKIVHVSLYAGDGMLLEAPGTGLAVRRIAAAERFGRPWDEIAPGTVIDGQTVRFGSYLTHAR